MEIRRATPEDLRPIVHELWRPFAAEMAEVDPYDELAPESTGPALDYRRDLLERDDVVMWVGVSDDEYHALATVERQASPPVFARGDSAHIHELYVTEPYRGTGVADSLVEYAERWAESRSCAFLTLDVNVGNDRARSFYENQGFEAKRQTMVRPL